MPGDSRTALALAFGVAVLAGAGLSAHRLDECLQATRIAVEPGRADIEVDLTPGTAAAGVMIATIDRDGDGSFSAAERRAYVGAVLDDLTLEVDGKPLRIAEGTSTFADVAALRQGEGTIRLRTSVNLPMSAGGDHRLFFRNSHATDGSVYLANALVPESDRVTVRAQRHDTAQRELTIDYVLLAEPPLLASAWPASALAALLVAALWIRKPTGGALRSARR